MLPYKHYVASEIEEVLQKNEDPAAPPYECGAEESTIRRWEREYPERLSALAACLETLANVTKVSLEKPLQRVYTALGLLIHPPPEESRLAFAYLVSQAHPVHVG
jgi:hypothetical protein